MFIAKMIAFRKSNVIVFVIISFVCFIYYFYTKPNTLTGSVAYQKLKYHQEETLVKNKILIYTKYYFLDWTDVFTGEKLFTDDRCIYTTDRNDIKTSQFVLIHLRDIRKFGDLPTEKLFNQKWILYNIESPMGNRRWDDMTLFRKIAPHFDLTMTYRLDSDIPVPYGWMTKNNPTNNSIINVEIDFEQKTKQIAWLVSNCESFSKREIIVEKIGQHMSIDIYGKCGNLSCPTGGKHFFKNEICYEMLSRDYKFYLSLENSLCTDYVTEKLFNTLNYDVIPVVYGGANYSHLLPANSYIDVRNFTSAKELVDYLHYVGNNEAIYKSYFEWRKDFHVEFDFPNKLCDFVLNMPSARPIVTEKKDIFNWWLEDTCEDLTNCCWT